MRSLGTSAKREAERLARVLGVDLDREFARLRANDSVGCTDKQVVPVLTQETFVAETAACETSAPSLKRVSMVSKSPSCLVELGNSPPRILTTTVGQVSSARTVREDPRGRSLAMATGKCCTSFAALIDQWALGVRPAQNTVQRTQMHVRRFEEMTGVHTTEEVTRQHAIRFIEQLQHAGQTPQNINMHLASLTKLLNYAVRLDLIKTNEASRLNVKAPGGEKARRSFDLAALIGIFRSPVYSLGHRPKGGGGEASYWLPLLALFTGARLEELCQLHPDDLMRVAYHDKGREASAWVIRITDEGEGQGLKNVGSRRRIPLHPELERLGFVSLAQQAKAEGRKRVFHNLAPSVDGKEGGNFSKWFGRYLRDRCMVKDKRMVFHSFRHFFKEAMREVEIPKEINDALTGHESGDVGDKYGGDLYPLRPLVNAIARYKVPGLVLPSPPNAALILAE
jgi:integrase